MQKLSNSDKLALGIVGFAVLGLIILVSIAKQSSATPRQTQTTRTSTISKSSCPACDMLTAVMPMPINQIGL